MATTEVNESIIVTILHHVTQKQHFCGNFTVGQKNIYSANNCASSPTKKRLETPVIFIIDVPQV